MDSEEGREVAIVYIPNSFPQTDMVLYGTPIFVLMVIRGTLCDLRVDIATEVYKRFVIKDKKGNSLIYVKMLKVMYRLMEESLMFYQKMVKDLNEIGFITNLYDPFVANKMIGGSQFTIVWHVDDMKLSH